MSIELMAALTVGLALGSFALYFARQMQARPADLRLSRLAERPVAAHRGIAWDEIRRRGPSSLPFLRNLLTESAWSKRVTLEIEQAGLRLRVGEYLVGRLAIGLVVFVAIWLVGGNVISFVLGAACGFFGFMLPAVWLTIVRKRRIDKISKQIPEAVSMIANSLRAGFAFQHGIDMVAQQMEPPISEEFARLIVDMNVGASVEEALHGLLIRADSEDVNMVVTAVLIQRSSGGNLSEILETVAETMRERERLTGEVKTMTSQQRFSGTVLTFWPLLLLGLFAAFNWSQTSLLFTTNVGLVLLAVGGVMQIMGYYTIRRILDIDI
ncbi:MAG: type II secretion system F family protein [Chloroflexota bacterium]|nr:type II secretion system F family protein [Chloroflexota bacterium]